MKEQLSIMATSAIWVQAALNGNREHPAVPRTPDELACDTVAVVKAGAKSVHLHPYDEHGRETLEAKHCAEVLRAVRSPLSRSSDIAHYFGGCRA